jgi:hypothetical protein
MSKSNGIYVKRGSQPVCGLPDCDSPFYAKNLCKKHYCRLLKHGDPHLRNGTIDGSFEERFWSLVDKTPGHGPSGDCWIWTGGKTGAGYGAVTHDGKCEAAHRVAWLLTKGKFPDLDLLHSCDNPPCVNPNHTREGGQAANIQDKVDRNRQAKGEGIGVSVLFVPQVQAIKRVVGKRSDRAIAKDFSVTPATIRSIRLGNTWGWL